MVESQVDGEHQGKHRVKRDEHLRWIYSSGTMD